MSRRKPVIIQAGSGGSFTASLSVRILDIQEQKQNCFGQGRLMTGVRVPSVVVGHVAMFAAWILAQVAAFWVRSHLLPSLFLDPDRPSWIRDECRLSRRASLCKTRRSRRRWRLHSGLCRPTKHWPLYRAHQGEALDFVEGMTVWCSLLCNCTVRCLASDFRISCFLERPSQ